MLKMLIRPSRNGYSVAAVICGGGGMTQSSPPPLSRDLTISQGFGRGAGSSLYKAPPFAWSHSVIGSSLARSVCGKQGFGNR